MKMNLERLKENSLFMKHLRWDVYPETLFRPRFISGPEKRNLIEETQGFMFYIDYMDNNASLMLMKTYNLTSKTIGEILDVPKELILNAVNREGAKDLVGMYPIDRELETWLKKALGLTP